ncbi:hypothetical protein SDC9_186949 [bioreactor metagenome]|uniref:Uncharacterized protein n=1 Tax=bioreactor metagenome TaxID=1076179 RepID=A0A645HK79_9ZZZZ
MSISAARRLRISFGCPEAPNTDEAIEDNSSGNPLSGMVIFTPIPTTAKSNPPLSSDIEASVSIPQIFLPSIQISLTHLICVSRPDSCSTAPATATAAAVVSRDDTETGILGRSRMLIYTPVPPGEKKLLPFRPRPAVCSSATITLPSGSPERASFFASSFVDPIVLYTSIRRCDARSSRYFLIPDADTMSVSGGK